VNTTPVEQFFAKIHRNFAKISAFFACPSREKSAIFENNDCKTSAITQLFHLLYARRTPDVRGNVKKKTIFTKKLITCAHIRA
jgi:hypothetical protein